jgi:hypothetical protein
LAEIRGTDIRPVIVSSCPSSNHTDFPTPLKAPFPLPEAMLYCFVLIFLPTRLHDEPLFKSYINIAELYFKDFRKNITQDQQLNVTPRNKEGISIGVM